MKEEGTPILYEHILAIAISIVLIVMVFSTLAFWFGVPKDVPQNSHDEAWIWTESPHELRVIQDGQEVYKITSTSIVTYKPTTTN